MLIHTQTGRDRTGTNKFLAKKVEGMRKRPIEIERERERERERWNVGQSEGERKDINMSVV